MYHRSPKFGLVVTAVMQPYLFPYIGYFQLLAVADHFVFYNDVQYINDGWINRNRLPHGWFTVPVKAGSLSDAIAERSIASQPYGHFRRKWRKGFAQRYGRAPYYPAVAGIVDAVFTDEPGKIDAMARKSIRLTAEYLGLNTTFTTSSDLAYDRELPTEEKLLSLLNTCGAKRYVNQIGGDHLYRPRAFADRGVELNFLSSTLEFGAEQPGFQYSILHLLTHHSPEQCREWLKHYTIKTPTPNEPI